MLDFTIMPEIMLGVFNAKNMPNHALFNSFIAFLLPNILTIGRKSPKNTKNKTNKLHLQENLQEIVHSVKYASSHLPFALCKLQNVCL